MVAIKNAKNRFSTFFFPELMYVGPGRDSYSFVDFRRGGRGQSGYGSLGGIETPSVRYSRSRWISRLLNTRVSLAESYSE
jgi:hypothetical protein